MNRAKTVLTTAVALALLTACGGGGGTSGDATGGGGEAAKAITFMAAQYDDNTEPYWTKLISDFEAQNPGYKVNLQVVNWDDIAQKVNTLIATKQQPDILNIDSFSAFAHDGLLQPVSDVVSPEVLSDFLPSFAASGSISGTQYAMPLIASVRTFFYNTDVFKEAGITDPPKTWDELLADAQKIKALPGDYIPYGLPGGTEEAHAELSLWMWNNGGDWTDSSGKWTINSTPNVQALQYMADLNLKYHVTQVNPGTTNRDELWKLFIQGKIGMMNGASFLPTLIAAQNPSLHYAVAQIPTNTGGAPVSLGIADYLMAFKNGNNTDAVKKFLNFFYAKDNYVNFVKTEGFLPTTTSGQQAMAGDPAQAPFLEALPEAKFYPADNPGWAEVQAANETAMGPALQGQTTPQEALDQVQARAERGQ